MTSNCEGFVAMGHITALSTPAKSSASRCPASVPSPEGSNRPSKARHIPAIARAATRGAKS